eukprot:PITA_17848
MVEEYNSIMVNDVREVVPRPQDRSVVGSRWIYKIKYTANGNGEKYKARFVAKRLKKSLYGPKQALRAWYGRIDGYLQKMGFIKSDADQNLYYLVVENEPLILVLYVDDLFLTGSSRLIGDCKKNLAMEFDMKDLGRMHYFLGLEVWQQKGEIFLGQGRYATEILKRFKMEDCRPMATPMITNWKKIDASEDKDVDPTLYRQLIGSLIYLGNTRPNISYAVNTLSQFMVEPKRAHWAVAKLVLRYIQGKIDYGLLYTRSKDIRLSGFTDEDWAGSSMDQKSTSGYCFNIGSGMTSYCNRKLKFVALSSAKVKYMATRTAPYEAIWLRKWLVNLFKKKMEATRIMCDNQSCNKLCENPVFHDQSKHIDIWCHFARDCVQQGVV